MAPKEKAKQLFEEFYLINPIASSNVYPDLVDETMDDAAKKCVTKCADEMISVLKEMPLTVSTKFYAAWWQQVKEENEKQSIQKDEGNY